MSTKVLQVFGSVPQPVISAMPVDLAMRLCLSQSPPLCQLLGVSQLKPLRPCIQPHSPESQNQQSHPTPSRSDWALSQTGISGDGTSTKKKRVVFADSKGLSLTAVHVFSRREELPPPEPSLNLRVLWRPAADRKADGARKPPRLGFRQPLADFQAFRARLQETLVLLESCSVTERSLSGTVQVKNVSFQKAVHVRVTFESWRSWRDVPCTFLHQRYGGPDADVFAFDIPLPKDLDPRERLEFCVSYLPGGHSTALWDNNEGLNYSVVCTESEAPPSCHPVASKPKPGSLWESQAQIEAIAVLISVSIAVSVFGSAHFPDLFFPHPPFLRYHPLCHTQAVIWRETQGDECKGERDG
ncbi:hypothetical protein SKAU_G00112050 [Synaphobranchus kaupii]|uniref:CBM21 domain-containing protein n=1 Tax=Synaphobranchus kaupii TaxID=118154 RepID=A0A9Q1J7F2_SYNKA|nr:hypothetical protein SKAU_G00112050 [Synaphobranchus kaupii]